MFYFSKSIFKISIKFLNIRPKALNKFLIQRRTFWQAILFSFLGVAGLEGLEEDIKRTLESIPIVERMTKIRNEIRRRQEQQLEERFQKGEIFKVGECGTQGEEDYQVGDQPGSSSNDPRPKIRAIRVLKVEIEDIPKKTKHKGSI